ncbi:phosphodiesterase [Streptosporangium carneum]|uniref:3',5'-cyclic adenosine monophosphate phosphodiesterase CpdA n=1 Tax=Streptosporangium carneum TaxID=47481 RepID=A0A9W6HV42_9ACTN|nr:phosphodiesterase [Streptosporangium carneum]GLK06901.1 3',5'-cyclic adenosine monophosphate phosphodiesterase CpdA [Streptosporangium carneum]
MLTLAHVSDIHIDDSPRSVERTRAVMRHLENLPGPLDAVIVTGDIADHGSTEEYEVARELLASRHPTVLCPGNHDSRAAFRKVLLGQDGDGPVNQVLRLDGLTVALCDSSVPGRPEGLLEEETLVWLDSVLAESSQTPVIVGMHHPAVALGIPYVDGIGLREPERLEAVLRRHPQAVAVLAGHAHTPASTWFAGRPLLVAPGVINTALIPAEARERYPVDLDLPPQIALHVFAEGRLTTHIRPIV